MYKIHVKRDLEIKAPFKILNEANSDWTHFSHLHRKSIASHRLLYKENGREIFLYKSRCLYPLPFYEYYIVFRDYPTPTSYRNVYVNVKTGRAHYLHVEMVCHGETTSAVSDYLFSLPSYWRFFPKLFLWIFKKRMRKIVDEDNEWVYERMTAENPIESTLCEPVIPSRYDPLHDSFKDDIFSEADSHFQFRDAEFFDDRKRWPQPVPSHDGR